ncbi:hypothetical protein [Seonamhaeicola sp.]|uniref:hypothetical protein n=1 Tax=Seonamhaeicola sp. TaxID=1912245 RepID=UPI003567DF06
MRITTEQLQQLDKGETTVRELFPEVFDKQLNTWYTGGRYLFFYNKYIPNEEFNFNYIGYGFVNEEWEWHLEFTKDGRCFENLATEKEVEKALIKEAKKRGYNYGVNVNCIENQSNQLRGFNIGSSFHFSNNKLWINDCGIDNEYCFCIFSNGKWAEIIEDDEFIELNGKTYKLVK